MNDGMIVTSGSVMNVFKEKDILNNVGLEIFDTLELIEMIEKESINHREEVLDILWELTYQK